MTLCLALLSDRMCVVCSDRRITIDGKVVTEEHDKSFAMFTPTAKVAVTFSGLATAGSSFETHKWLMDAAREAGSPDYQLLGIATRLAARLTNLFKTHPIIRRAKAGDKRLSVMISGYNFDQNDHAHRVHGIISNFENAQSRTETADAQDQFLFYPNNAALEPAVTTDYIGNGNALQLDDIMRIREAAAIETPQRITERLVGQIRKAVFDDRSENLIGTQINSLHISPDRRDGAVTDYYSSKVRTDTVMAPAVWVDQDGGAAIQGITIAPEDAKTPPIVVPKVGKNKLCGCNSGLRYKNCHGKKKKALISGRP